MLAEFEEKEFEVPLSAQLSANGPLPWSPGQVLEHLVGFDVALMVSDVVFWASVGFAPIPDGLPVSPHWWQGWPAVLLRPLFRLRRPPPDGFNLFLQYKRPEYLARGDEYKHWRSHYFRFHVTPHQQLALEACAQSLGHEGLVAYGSPAFYLRDDLFRHMRGRSLVANTHFASALKLANHSRYTYVSAHRHGIAHSKPVKVRPILFFDGPPDGPPGSPDDGGTGDGLPPDALLKAAERATQAAVDASPLIVGGREAFDDAIKRARQAIDFLRPGLGEREQTAVDAFVVAAIFARTSGILWLVGARRSLRTHAGLAR